VGIIGGILLAFSVFEKEHALMKYSFSARGLLLVVGIVDRVGCVDLYRVW
jgi:hypothetical protein